MASFPESVSNKLIQLVQLHLISSLYFVLLLFCIASFLLIFSFLHFSKPYFSLSFFIFEASHFWFLFCSGFSNLTCDGMCKKLFPVHLVIWTFGLLYHNNSFGCFETFDVLLSWPRYSLLRRLYSCFSVFKER